MHTKICKSDSAPPPPFIPVESVPTEPGVQLVQFPGDALTPPAETAEDREKAHTHRLVCHHVEVVQFSRKPGAIHPGGVWVWWIRRVSPHPGVRASAKRYTTVRFELGLGFKFVHSRIDAERCLV